MSISIGVAMAFVIVAIGLAIAKMAGKGGPLTEVGVVCLGLALIIEHAGVLH
jgi:hypothetical protein